jgi:arsenate reductase (thioredoxin)
MQVKKVLFLCVGNSCRSQMAEGFARKYGSDVMQPSSAGVAPAPVVQPLTKKVMEAKNINIDDQFPKDVDQVGVKHFDLIINMSGNKFPDGMPMEVRDWQVEDPIGRDEEVYVTVRDQLETQVMTLILELRRESGRMRHAARVGTSGGRVRATRRR